MLWILNLITCLLPRQAWLNHLQKSSMKTSMKGRRKIIVTFQQQKSTLLVSHSSKSSIDSSSFDISIFQSPESLKKITGSKNTFDLSSHEITSKRTSKIFLSSESLPSLNSKETCFAHYLTITHLVSKMIVHHLTSLRKHWDPTKI